MSNDKGDITTEVTKVGGSVFETDAQVTTRIEQNALSHLITVLDELDTFWGNHLTGFKYGIVNLDLKIEGAHDKAESIAKIIHYKLGYPDTLDKLVDAITDSQGPGLIETATTLLYTTLSMNSMQDLFGGNIDLMNEFIKKVNTTTARELLFKTEEEHLETNLNSYICTFTPEQFASLLRFKINLVHINSYKHEDSLDMEEAEI